MTADVDIQFVKTWNEDEIVTLYKTGGWWRESYKKSDLPRLMAGSYVFAVAVDTESGKAVGMGRVLSDGHSDAYIQDLVVLPEYRGRGLGEKLVDSLVRYCLSQGIKWIGLIAEPGSEQFYRNIGFAPMVNYIPLIYKVDE